MNLRAAILSADPAAWAALLAQIGFPSVVPASGAPHDVSLTIVADDASPGMIDAARAALAAGGAVLCSGRVHALLAGKPATERSIGYLIQDEPDGTFPGIGLVDCASVCRVPAGANAVRSGDGRPSVYAGECGGGVIVALPFDPSAFAADVRAVEKSFWRERGRLPYERVSRVSRGGVRRLVARAIEHLHHARSLPYAHLWHFPGDAASLFAFRVDTDFASEAEARALGEFLVKNEVPATWFVHVEGQEGVLPYYASLPGHEIGIHCYAHQAFEERSAILADVRTALAAMERAGIRPRGYAGPYGRWSPALASALSELGVDYSSEFSYAYDDLPSYPAAGGPLQVPIHPIGVGNLRRQGYGEAEMGEYLACAARSASIAGEPLFFYTHPKNGHHGALERLFAAARAADARPVVLGDYARWWKRRLAAVPSVSWDGSALALDGPADVAFRVTRADGRAALAFGPGRCELPALPWAKVAAPGRLPSGIGRTRAFNPWIAIHRAENALHSFLRRP